MHMLFNGITQKIPLKAFLFYFIVIYGWKFACFCNYYSCLPAIKTKINTKRHKKNSRFFIYSLYYLYFITLHI